MGYLWCSVQVFDGCKQLNVPGSSELQMSETLLGSLLMPHSTEVKLSTLPAVTAQLPFEWRLGRVSKALAGEMHET